MFTTKKTLNVVLRSGSPLYLSYVMMSYVVTHVSELSHREPKELLSDKELNQAVLDSLETIKPPSKWGEALRYFLIGVCGGVGIGMLIAFLRLG